MTHENWYNVILTQGFSYVLSRPLHPPAPAKYFYSCEWTLDEDLQRSALQQQTTGLRHTASVSEEDTGIPFS